VFERQRKSQWKPWIWHLAKVFDHQRKPQWKEGRGQLRAFSQGLDSYEGVMTLVALVGALVARVAPCDGREFPFNGASIRNAAKSRQGGDDPLGPCLIV
jgi:hypothetical protein